MLWDLMANEATVSFLRTLLQWVISVN